MCRKVVDGRVFDLPVDIKLNVDPINNPNARNTYGTWRIVLGDDRTKVNCKGQKYDYHEINIDPNWVAVRGGWTFTHADNKAFWDFYYRDYDGPEDGKCDYSQNCHGFAFNVGDWPGDASTGVILNLTPLEDRCYQFSGVKDATIASLPDHSIRVVGKLCHQIPPVQEQSHLEMFIHSSEQFRESGTYTQTSSCTEGGVNINLAHTRAGVSYVIFGLEFSGFPYGLYRPYQGQGE
jgi:hypothetical protein